MALEQREGGQCRRDPPGLWEGDFVNQWAPNAELSVDAEDPPVIGLCASNAGRLAEAQTTLAQANYRYRRLAIDAAESLDGTDLLIIDGAGDSQEPGIDYCRRAREKPRERFLPIIFVTDREGEAARARSSVLGADGQLVHPIEPVDLLAQVAALLRIKNLQDRLLAQSVELNRVNRRLQLAHEQIDQELALARRIQESFLPQSLEPIERVHFAARLEVSGRIGGDFYDVFRLGDRMVGFYVADAMGHGVPASLLTIYVKKGLNPWETTPEGQRVLGPADALENLNRDLIAQNLSENPFITMVYFTLDLDSLELTFSRAGHPYPLLLRPGEPTISLETEGTLLGIMETAFQSRRLTLREGDRLIVFTDGIDGVEFEGARQGTPSFLASIERRRNLPADKLVDAVYGDLFPDRRHEDDFTLFVVEIVSS